jgi:hypothetical protein
MAFSMKTGHDKRKVLVSGIFEAMNARSASVNRSVESQKMNTGHDGKRAGAGRKPQPWVPALTFEGMTAVEFLVAIYLDPAQPTELRFKAAVAAAPYEQPKLGAAKSEYVGKKQQAIEAAAIGDDPAGEWAHLN